MNALYSRKIIDTVSHMMRVGECGWMEMRRYHSGAPTTLLYRGRASVSEETDTDRAGDTGGLLLPGDFIGDPDGAAGEG